MAPRILIVDDSPEIRLVLRRMLRKAGYGEVLEAASGEKALEILRTVEVDLILLDVEMEGMDGLSTCRAIREHTGLLDVPIIMVTAREDTKTLQEAFQSGALDYVRKPFQKAELLARVRSALRLKQEMDLRKQREKELETLTRELEEANEKLRELSRTDSLTGLANRRVFDEFLHKEFSRAQRHGRPLALLMMDVDRFKTFNDTYGHLAGDACLQSVAKVFQKTLSRSSDLAARYGGEEFAGLLPETDPAGALRVAQNVLEEVRALGIPHKGLPWGVVSVSIGVAAYTRDFPKSPEDLVARADEALYKAKNGGRNRIVMVSDQVFTEPGGIHG